MSQEYIKGNGRDHIAEKFKEAGAAFSDAAGKTREAITDAATKAKENATIAGSEAIDKIMKETEKWQQQSSAYIRKKPLVALGGAALAGFMLALIFRKR